MRPDGMSPLTTGLEENAGQTTKNMYRYLLRDSRQRLIFLWPSTFLILLCSMSTVDALAFYVGTSNGQSIREQPKAIQRETQSDLYESSNEDDDPTSNEKIREAVALACQAAHLSEKFRSRLKDPIEFLKVCELIRETIQNRTSDESQPER